MRETQGCDNISWAICQNLVTDFDHAVSRGLTITRSTVYLCPVLNRPASMSHPLSPKCFVRLNYADWCYISILIIWGNNITRTSLCCSPSLAAASAGYRPIMVVFLSPRFSSVTLKNGNWLYWNPFLLLFLFPDKRIVSLCIKTFQLNPIRFRGMWLGKVTIVRKNFICINRIMGKLLWIWEGRHAIRVAIPRDKWDKLRLIYVTCRCDNGDQDMSSVLMPTHSHIPGLSLSLTPHLHFAKFALTAKMPAKSRLFLIHGQAL